MDTQEQRWGNRLGEPHAAALRGQGILAHLMAEAEGPAHEHQDPSSLQAPYVAAQETHGARGCSGGVWGNGERPSRRDHGGPLHLRRLHMGVIGASLMGVEVDDSQRACERGVEQMAKEIVDAGIVMVVNRRLRGRTIRDMLAWGGAGRASSSTDPSWPREVELLRRWLNEHNG